jgi:hypothetical protein
MTDIHIICLQEVADLAQALARLLRESYGVRLNVGHEARFDLDTSRRPHDIVLAIWSPDVKHQIFISEWAARTGPERLIEISYHVQHLPRVVRDKAVIDFSAWRGEPDGRAWNELNAHLRTAARALEPEKAPPKPAAFALAALSAMAVGGALALRLHAPAPTVAAFEPDLHPIETQTGIGGALDQSEIVEPPSVDDVFGVGRLPPRMASMPRASYTPLMTLAEYHEVEIRDPTLLERLRDFNPLRSRRNDD